MLQVSHLTKIYKTKGGVSVTALDDVSVRFPETGMVFLLGKSGSGKSTLLNVCGGLDSPTEGEIIVKGRSSKDFSQSDFDSYRNTFVGFIFQEYNILNEFSVEDNIALALELQGKPKDKAAIAALLEEVDLTGYAKRKPNTLSGGQKQRIAIARALVKAPEIIMADEPTGALDSATGKQVLDTLKKLSKTKLVLVVSHDRDFAEQYGDRIIELKDGKILSDVSKTQEETRNISENVSIVGSTVCVKKGSELTEKDFNEIKTFLRGVDGDVMIASGERDIKNFREASRITEDGQKEVFRATDESKTEQKTYSPADSKFIRSKLPLRHAVKIGVSGLKTKPFRLFFTVLLCTVAFVLFGLFSTMTFYNSEATFKQTLKDSNCQTLRISKSYRTFETSYENGTITYSYVQTYDARFTPAELDAYAKQFGEDAFGAIAANGSFQTQTSSDYYECELDSYGVLRENAPLRAKITGAYPTKDTEILLSSYTANSLVACKVSDSQGNILTLTRPEELIGKTLNVGQNTFTVSGIFDSGEIPQKFDPIRDEEKFDQKLMNEWYQELGDGLHLVAFLTESKLLELSKDSYTNSPSYYNQSAVFAYQTVNGDQEYPEGSNAYYQSFEKVSVSTHYLVDTPTLGDDQTVLDVGIFLSLMHTEISNARSGAWTVTEAARDRYGVWQDEHYEQNFDGEINIYELCMSWENEYAQGTPHVNDGETDELYEGWFNAYLPYADALKNYEKYEALLEDVRMLSEGWSPITAEEREAIFQKLFTYIEENEIALQISFKLYNNDNSTAIGEEKRLTVVGVANIDATGRLSRYHTFYVNGGKFNALWTEHKNSYEYYSEFSTAYVPPADGYYSSVYLPCDRSDKAIESFWELCGRLDYDETDTKLYYQSITVDNVLSVDELIGELSKVFLWLGVVLAVFAALLLSNFISVSISQKKREIGILRAVGARGVDVFKIFFSESFAITAICAVISVIGSLILCYVLNSELAANLGASIFNFGALSLLTLLLIAGLTAIVATFLPVWNAARKKPVDSIRAL